MNMYHTAVGSQSNDNGIFFTHNKNWKVWFNYKLLKIIRNELKFQINWCYGL
jgi:hypothetical protein